MSQAPPDYKPSSVLHQGHKLPPAVRSRYRKFDIYRDVSQFGYVDDHAIKVITLSCEFDPRRVPYFRGD